MEQATTFWLTTATSEATPDLLAAAPVENNDLLSKSGDLSSMFHQPAVLNFATIFAGASAAVSPGTSNMVTGQRVPSLSQIGIPPTKRTTLIPISHLQTIPSINHLTPLLQAQVPSTSTVVVNSLNGITPLTTTIYTLPLPSDPIQIPKNFIQQAAAASGLAASTSGLCSSSTNDLLISQSTSERINAENSITASTPDSQVVMPVSTQPVQAITLQSPTATCFQCTDCGKTFENSGQLSYHTFVSHGELQARPHKCTACPESFLMDHHLRDHMNAIHISPEQGGGPPFTCSECMASFNDGGHLNFHLYMAHTIQGSKPAQEQFPCPECGKNFIKSTLRAAHIRNVHSGQVYAVVPPNQIRVQLPPVDAGTQKCTECGKGFKTLSYLRQHVMSVHEKPLKCTVCERGFGRRSDLKRHMRGVHMRKRPHQCSKCGWTFSEFGNLKHHLQAVHQKEKNYRCMYCDKTFSLSSYLRNHLTKMHNISVESLKTPVSSDQWSRSLELEETPRNSEVKIDTEKKGRRRTNKRDLCCKITTRADNENVQATIPTEAVTSREPEIGVSTTTAHNSIALPTFQISIAQAHVARCYECGQTFQNTQMLQNHVMSTHPQPFWCTVCGEGFSHAAHLQLHLQLRHVSNDQTSVNAVQTVQAIGLQNNGQIALEIHEALPEPQPMTTQQLTIAPQSTRASLPLPSPVTSQQSVVQLRQTLQTLDTSSISNDKCELCGVQYSTTPEEHVCWRKLPLINQIGVSDVAIVDDRPHLCTECGKGFKTTTHLKQHVRCVHSKERPHKCSHCEKCFARTSDLNRHVKGVHQRLKSVRNAVFITLKCSECGAIYAETSQLKRHIYTHHLHGRPSYKCADCQESFTDESAFQRHICHEDERPHVCSFCSKRFQMAPQLRRHMRAAHGRQSGDPQIHKCFQCERIFGRPIDLERHIQAVHLKEKPHKCTVCSKTFGLQGNLNKHVRAVHLLEKPNQCIECGKRFAHVGVLKRHLRDIHFYDKKATVKQRLAQIQIKNARALMCNIANMRCSVSDSQAMESQEQQQQREAQPQINSMPQPQTVQTISRQTDLPRMENIPPMAGQQQSPITLAAPQQIVNT